MPIGTMGRWNWDKGFGFIYPADKGEENVFCHVSQLLNGEDSMEQGDQVRYCIKYSSSTSGIRISEVRCRECFLIAFATSMRPRSFYVTLGSDAFSNRDILTAFYLNRAEESMR